MSAGHGEKEEPRGVSDESTAGEGAAAYEFSPDGNQDAVAKITGSHETAATSEEGNAPRHYFGKYLEQKFTNIDEKFLNIRESLAQMREQENQRQLEMRERDNQRHAEILALSGKIENALSRIEARFAHIEEKYDLRLDHIDAQFAHMEEKNDSRFDRMEERHDSRVAHTEEKYDSWLERFEARSIRQEEKYDRSFKDIDSRFKRLEDKFDNKFQWVIGLSSATLLSIFGIIISIAAKL